MTPQASATRSASFDEVGRYKQDDINGFDDTLIDRMLDAANLGQARTVLDAMAGDGNLTMRIVRYCERRSIPVPAITVLEYSRVQTEFARAELEPLGVRVVWGDVLSMAANDTKEPLPDGSFDRVLIKSALHELRPEEQRQLCRSVSRVLAPGGLFVNLGFVFDDPVERDEFREIARTKDTLAGLTDAAERRHFTTRDELRKNLSDAGIAEVSTRESFLYRIHSAVVARYYFLPKGLGHADADHQAAQARALRMRSKGRVRFEREHSTMEVPGEITVGRKPEAAEETALTFKRYPYDFLRWVACHRELLDRAMTHIERGSTVLDLACGPGLLARRLMTHGVTYRGLDLSPEFIGICNERYGATPGFAFEVADMNTARFGAGEYGVVTILNALNLEGVNPVEVLRKAIGALKPGGRIVVSGPLAPDSYVRVEPLIRAQLEQDGLLPANEETLQAISRANARILSQRGNYWSVEGMVALLCELGAGRIESADTGVYHGFGYLVVARR